MFMLKDEVTYWWPVKVKQPHPEKSGEWITETFKAKFRALPEDEAKEISDRGALDDREQHELLKRTIVDWDAVKDADGPVAFSDENLTRMLQWSFVRIGFYNALSESISGEKRRLGN